MKLTDLLAIWGAVVATIVAIWNIYKDFIRRDKVKVSAGFRLIIPPGDDAFVFYVTNLTSYRIRVQTCAGASEAFFHNRWMRRLLWRVFPDRGQHYIFSGVTVNAQSLPIPVEPRDSTMIIYSIKPNDFPVVGDLYVTTSDGKEWFCHRKEIEAIHNDEVYKSLQEKRYIPYSERRKNKPQSGSQ